MTELPWNNEDTRYLVALLTILLVVAYLVAGNFGLVPSPIPDLKVRPVGQVVSVPDVPGDEVTPSPSPSPTVRPGPTPSGRRTPKPSGQPTSPPGTPGPTLLPTPPPSSSPCVQVVPGVCV